MWPFEPLVYVLGMTFGPSSICHVSFGVCVSSPLPLTDMSNNLKRLQ